jgi:hypothetical protein
MDHRRAASLAVAGGIRGNAHTGDVGRSILDGELEQEGVADGLKRLGVGGLCRAADDDAGFAFVADMAVDAWPANAATGNAAKRKSGWRVMVTAFRCNKKPTG